MKAIIKNTNKQKLKMVDFQAISFAKGEQCLFAETIGERFIVLLSGELGVELRNNDLYNLPFRASVFKDPAAGVFVPGGLSFTVKAATKCEIAIYESLLPPLRDLKSFMVTAEQLSEKNVGNDNYQRQVVDILSKDMDADFLLVGETFSEPGRWSSYPPHKHDKNNYPKETDFEEIYFFKVARERSFAFQAVYSYEHQEECVRRIFNNDIMKIKRGFHPVAAPPDSDLYYLWGLSGNKRELCWCQEEGF